MFSLIRKFYKDESGATLVEYGLLVALIAAAVAVTVYALGDQLNTLFSEMKDCVTSPSSTNC